MTFISYAQNLEDVLLWRVLRDVEQGRYLDIGAQDPVFDSVSLAFYEAGWRGVHVEASPAYAEAMRAARPDETVIEAAVSTETGSMEFHDFPDTGLSTGKREIAQRHASQGISERKIVVKTKRLEEILDDEEDDFHWMKVDVEGMEPEVLRSWGTSKKRPWVLVVEATYPLSQEPTHDSWENEVLSRGYRFVHFDGLSRYFLHEKQIHLLDRFNAPVNIFDLYVVTRRHFSAAPLRGELEQLEDRLAGKTSRLHGLEEELAQLRSQLERAVTDRETAIAERISALQTLVAAQREYQETNARFSAEFAAAQVELARVSERASQLADHLATSEQRLAESHERRKALERASADLREQVVLARSDRNQIQGELAAERAMVLRADTLIRRAVQNRPGFFRRLGEGLGLIRPHHSLRALLDWSLAGKPEPSLALDRASVEGRRRANFVPNPSLDELLCLEGSDFVECAYVTLLGRPSDAEGAKYYLDRLQRGRPKLQVLAQLHESKEGRSKAADVPGLKRAIKLGRWTGWRWPLSQRARPNPAEVRAQPPA